MTGTEIEIARRQQLLAAAKARLDAIESAPKASEADVNEAVRVLLGSYPQAKAANLDVYMRQLRSMLVGEPLNIVMELVNPKTGIVMQCAFLPTIAEISKWLEPHLMRFETRKHAIRSEIETLLPPPPAPTKEERARRVEAMEHKFPRKPKATPFFWLQPDYAEDDTRLKAMQRPDAPEGRASLLQTDLMRGDDDPNANQS